MEWCLVLSSVWRDTGSRLPVGSRADFPSSSSWRKSFGVSSLAWIIKSYWGKREKRDAEACCWGSLSGQGNGCAVSANAYYSVLTWIALLTRGGIHLQHPHPAYLSCSGPKKRKKKALIKEKKNHAWYNNCNRDHGHETPPCWQKMLVVWIWSAVAQILILFFSPRVGVGSIPALFCGKELLWAPTYGRKFQLGKSSSLELSAWEN